MEIKPSDCSAVLLEYDKRFSTYGPSFIFYDYKEPLHLPDSLSEKYFDVVVADPPFLSEECLAGMSKTILFLAKNKIILCTGKFLKYCTVFFHQVIPIVLKFKMRFQLSHPQGADYCLAYTGD